MKRRVQIIANPIAGGGRGKLVAPELAHDLRGRGFDVDVFLTTQAGDARTCAGTLHAESTWAVVAVGGDGTINEVLNGLPDPSIRFATLPLGTANVLACELRLPRAPSELAALIAADHTIDAAIGVANGRRFLLFLGVGLDARMVHRLEAVRTGKLGKHKWVGPALHVVRHWPNDRIRVETAEGFVFENASQVLVTRVRNYGGVFALPGSIAIDDGLLHVLCFDLRTRAQYLAASWRAFRGRLREGRDVRIFASRALTITAAGQHVPAHVDGDGHGFAPQRVELAAQRARLFAPPPADRTIRAVGAAGQRD